MTTIAVRNGIVAYDTRMTQGGLIHPQRFDKAVVSVKHQAIFAGAGVPGQILAMFRLLEQAHALPWEDPDLDLSVCNEWDNFEVMVLTKDGRIYNFEDNNWFYATGEFHACGSGSMAAISAMHAGANAIDAVKIAAKVDCNTGEPVKFIDINWIPERPRMANFAGLDLAVNADDLVLAPAPVKSAKKPVSKGRAK